MQKDPDLVEVEIAPDELVPGQDADGLPRTDAPKPKAKAERKAEPAVDIEALKRERETLARERDAEREARARVEAEAIRRIDAERKAREAAEAERDRTTGIATNAHWTTLHERHENIATTLKATQNYLTQAQYALQKALADGDHETAAQLNTKIGLATSDLRSLERGESAIKDEIERVRGIFNEAHRRRQAEAEVEDEPEAKAPQQQPPQQQTPEQWIAQFPRKTTGGWLSDHKDYVTDPEKHRELLKFANDYVQDYGQTSLHSAHFVEQLNAKFFPQAAEEEETVTEPEAEAEMEVEVERPAKKMAPAAPVSRSATPASRSSTGGTIKLTPEQYAIAPTLYKSYDDLSPEAKAKFPAWSENAARWQYHQDLKRAEKDGKFLPRG